jgi:hypothetical protein
MPIFEPEKTAISGVFYVGTCDRVYGYGRVRPFPTSLKNAKA